MSFRGNTVAAVGGGVAGLGVLPRGPNTEESMIPTAEDLDAWMETLRGGYASKEMLPRVIEGYKRLLKVAEAATAFVDGDEGDADEDFDALEYALDALDAPMPEVP